MTGYAEDVYGAPRKGAGGTASQIKEKRKIGLTTTIFIGLILGAVTGILLHYMVPAEPVRDSVVINGIFYVVGDGFLRLVQMLVVPLVFCSLVCGSMVMGDTKKLGRIGVKTLGFYLVATALAITAAILTTNVIGSGRGLDMTFIGTANVAIGKRANLAGTLLAITPTNPLHALASGDMLSIILFALFVGAILAGLGENGETVGSFFNQFNDVMMQMTVMVIELTPCGVFYLTARTFSSIDFGAFVSSFRYMAGVMIALTIQCLVVYMVILRVFTGLSPDKFLKKLLSVMGFAFSTATSNATIPMSIDALHRKMRVAKRISSFIIPLGATINMGGTATMQGVAVVLASRAFGIHLAMADYLTAILTATLASIGTTGIPGVGLVTPSMTFISVGLPVEAIALIMGINRTLDMDWTAVNITGDTVCTIIMVNQDRAVDREAFNDPEAGAGMKE